MGGDLNLVTVIGARNIASSELMQGKQSWAESPPPSGPGKCCLLQSLYPAALVPSCKFGDDCKIVSLIVFLLALCAACMLRQHSTYACRTTARLVP